MTYIENTMLLIQVSLLVKGKIFRLLIKVLCLLMRSFVSNLCIVQINQINHNYNNFLSEKNE